MKKLKIIIPVLLLCIAISCVLSYFVYGNTLIDITNEKSISNNLADNPAKAITILKTTQIGDYFAILYTDPVDEEDGYVHFRYITKAKFYKNKYHNIGGGSAGINNPYISWDELNRRDENRKTAEVFIYTSDKSLLEDNKCSVFKYNATGTYINFEEVKSAEEIIEKIDKRANSYEKIDEFELPDDNVFIFGKTYALDNPDDIIWIVNGSVTEEDIRQEILAESDTEIKEYYNYLKGAE